MAPHVYTQWICSCHHQDRASFVHSFVYRNHKIYKCTHFYGIALKIYNGTNNNILEAKNKRQKAWRLY